MECTTNYYKIFVFDHVNDLLNLVNVKFSIITGISYIFFHEQEMKIAAFAISEDLDEVAHHEPPHLDLHCLPSSL